MNAYSTDNLSREIRTAFRRWIISLWFILRIGWRSHNMTTITEACKMCHCNVLQLRKWYQKNRVRLQLTWKQPFIKLLSQNRWKLAKTCSQSHSCVCETKQLLGQTLWYENNLRKRRRMKKYLSWWVIEIILECHRDIFGLFFFNGINCSHSFRHHDGTQLPQHHCVFMCVCLLNRIMGTSTLLCYNFKGKTISVQINIQLF